MNGLLRHRKQLSLSERLSLLADEPESVERDEQLKALLKEYPAARQEFEEIVRIRTMLKEKTTAPPAVGFKTRLFAEIDAREKDGESFLPIPRKYRPVFAGISVMTFIFIGIIAFQYRSDIFNTFRSTKDQFQEVYENSILKGALRPVFTDVTQDQVVNYAVFGILPLDAKAETGLQVDHSEKNGYSIQFGRRPDRKGKTQKLATKTELYSALDLDREQRRAVDSLLAIARYEIQRSVYIDEHNSVAVDPGLANYNRSVLANVAACLDEHQLRNFNRFLEARSAPYAIPKMPSLPSIPSLPSMPGLPSFPKHYDEAIRDLRRAPLRGRFIVVSPETVQYNVIPAGLDSLHKEMQAYVSINEGKINTMHVRLQNLFKMREEQQHRFSYSVKPFVVEGDSDYCNIRIESSWTGVGSEPMVVVTSRPVVIERVPPPMGGVPRVPRRIYRQRDTTTSGIINYWRGNESLYLRPDTLASIEKYIYELNKMHSRRIDSLMQEMKIYQLQTDSLLNAIPLPEIYEQYKKVKKLRINEPEEI
jgi:hypothetical protein